MAMEATVTDDIEDQRHETGEKMTVFKYEDCLYCLSASYQFKLKAKYSSDEPCNTHYQLEHPN